MAIVMTMTRESHMQMFRLKGSGFNMGNSDGDYFMFSTHRNRRFQRMCRKLSSG